MGNSNEAQLHCFQGNRVCAEAVTEFAAVTACLACLLAVGCVNIDHLVKEQCSILRSNMPAHIGCGLSPVIYPGPTTAAAAAVCPYWRNVVMEGSIPTLHT